MRVYGPQTVAERTFKGTKPRQIETQNKEHRSGGEIGTEQAADPILVAVLGTC